MQNTARLPLVFVMLCMMGSGLARADLPEDDRMLVGDVLAIGVAADGSLTNRALDLGILLDPDGPEGRAPIGGDALLPGRAFELWSLSTDDGRRWVQGEADLGSDLRLDFERPEASPLLDAVTATGGDADLSVQWQMVVRAHEGLLLLTLEVEAIDTLPGLRLARVFDPDLDSWSAGSYATRNVATEDVVVASSAVDARALALSAAGGRAGLCAWCSDADLLIPGSSEGDDQLGVWVELGDVPAGTRRTVHLAYAIGADSLDTAAAAQAAAAAADLDGDGATDAADCAPLDPARASGHVESTDGIDNDCDGQIDENDADAPGSPREDWAEAGSAPDTAAAEADEAADKPSAGCATSPRPHLAFVVLCAAVAVAAFRARSPR